MRKFDNDWWIETDRLPSDHCSISINGMSYKTTAGEGAICHSLMLLVDALNDKSFSCKKGDE